MIICHCNAATDGDIRHAAAQGEASCSGVAQGCRAGTSCGGCLPAIMALLKGMGNDRPDPSVKRSK
ncbi:MAG: hypothetical protein CMJ89_16385 [Planctomycetes bacterium]|nr:hypothetical protein [Planctomycetota bacterium]